MNSNKLTTELAAARAKLARLEAEAVKLRNRELALLPEKFGFADVNALIDGLKALGKVEVKAAPTKTASNKAPAAPKPRKRAKITEETRTELQKMVESGKTGLEIAKALKVSLPTVHNIKKALGLVRPTKKKVLLAAKKPESKPKTAGVKPVK